MLELETFNIFDIFESEKLVKAKGPEIITLIFYQKLLMDIINNKNGGTIQLVLLFEEYLKEKSIFLKNMALSVTNQ